MAQKCTQRCVKQMIGVWIFIIEAELVSSIRIFRETETAHIDKKALCPEKSDHGTRVKYSWFWLNFQAMLSLWAPLDGLRC